MKNELWDSHMFVETAVAERRTAGIWCGSKEAEWWRAPLASMATMAPMDTKLNGLIGVYDVLGYDYHGKMAVPIDDFCTDS